MKFSIIYAPLITAVILAATMLGLSGTNAAQGSVATSFNDHGNAANTAGTFTADKGQNLKCFEQFMACTKNMEHSTQETNALSAKQIPYLKDLQTVDLELIARYEKNKAIYEQLLSMLRELYDLEPDISLNDVTEGSPKYDVLKVLQTFEYVYSELGICDLIIEFGMLGVHLNPDPTQVFSSYDFNRSLNTILLQQQDKSTQNIAKHVIDNLEYVLMQIQNDCSQIKSSDTEALSFLTNIKPNACASHDSKDCMITASEDKKNACKSNKLVKDKESMDETGRQETKQSESASSDKGETYGKKPCNHKNDDGKNCDIVLGQPTVLIIA